MPGYGWIPDRPDVRDHHFALPLAATPPTTMDLRSKCPPVYDQGELGSCTANAIAGALEFAQIAQGEPQLMPSRLWIYYQERVKEHSVSSDAGAAIRDGIKVVAQLGACAESDWPYDIRTFTGPPPASCAPDARLHQALDYQRVPNDGLHLQAALASGYPIVFGFTVYESFLTDAVATTGVMTMPAPHESVAGGHAVLMVGYDDAREAYLVRNSWGPDWGEGGYFWMPYRYPSRRASDFWQVRRISA